MRKSLFPIAGVLALLPAVAYAGSNPDMGDNNKVMLAIILIVAVIIVAALVLLLTRGKK